MKIAIDISQIVYGTGVSVYTRNLVTNLIKLYPKIEFVLFAGSLRQAKKIKSFVSRLKAEKRIIPLPPRLLDVLWNSFHIFPIEKIIGTVDLIHTSDWTEPPSKLPKVTTIHDLIPFKYPSQTTSLSVQATHRKRLSWVIRESKVIFVVSKSTKKDLLDLFKIDPDRIMVTYEGVERLFSPQPPDLIQRMKQKYCLGDNYIFSLSSIEPRKNLDKLILAFRKVKLKIPNLKLLIGGQLGWGTRLETDPDIFTPGFLPDADLPALYSGCACYCLPSLYEGFSLSHLQAMACGAAVVGSNISSMPEVIGSAGILIDPNNVDSIAAGIVKSLKNKTSLSAKAIRRAKLFTWEETARLTFQGYKKAII